MSPAASGGTKENGVRQFEQNPRSRPGRPARSRPIAVAQTGQVARARRRRAAAAGWWTVEWWTVEW